MKLLYIPAPAILQKGYGGIFNWYVTQDSRGICPAGWHVPTISEIKTMLDDVGASGNYDYNTIAYKLREAGIEHWEYLNESTTNESGFTAIGSGVRDSDGEFGEQKQYFYIWTTSGRNIYKYDLMIPCYDNSTSIGEGSPKYGFSLRFFKNDSIWNPGDTVTDIDGNIYHTVKIGNQVIMAENYKGKHYNNGDAIPLVTDNTAWANPGGVGMRCYYDNDPTNE